MPLPWLIGAAIIAAGAAIYNAVKEDDTPSTSDNSAERTEAARKAQKEKDRADKKIEIIKDTKNLLYGICEKNKDLVEMQYSIIDDDGFFLKLKNLDKIEIKTSHSEWEAMNFLNHLNPTTHLSEKQRNKDTEISLLTSEIKELNDLNLRLIKG